MEVDIWLHKSTRPWRDLVTDLSHFRSIAPPLSGSKKRSKGKGKDKDGDESKLSIKAGATLKTFFTSIGWTEEHFTKTWGLVFAEMAKKRNRSNRLAKDLVSRIVCLCGLPWNSESANRARDWESVALVITIEIALVGAYRKSLVFDSSGAQVLRSKLRTFFLQRTAIFRARGSDQKEVSVLQWEFADMVELPSDLASGPDKIYNPEELWADWAANSPSFDTKDPIASAVLSWQKNKYLRCLDPAAPPGTVESLAHFLLLLLASVRIPIDYVSLAHYFPCRSCIKTRPYKSTPSIQMVMTTTSTWRVSLSQSLHGNHTPKTLLIVLRWALSLFGLISFLTITSSLGMMHGTLDPLLITRTTLL